MDEEVRTKSKIVQLEFPALGLARLEISRLASDPAYQTRQLVGGTTPPEVEEENERIRARRRRRELEIIQKHGVADAFLAPLVEEEKRRSKELWQLREHISELRDLSKK